MTEFQLDLLRRREAAKRLFERLSVQADAAGAEHLARRLRSMGWNVGSRIGNATPPGLAVKLEKRMPRLLARAAANPKASFFELIPLPPRQKIRGKVEVVEQNKGTRR